MTIRDFFLFSILMATLSSGVVNSCTHKPAAIHEEQHRADSLINAAYAVHDYDSILTLADELESKGNISEMEADYWRGYAYNRMRKMRLAENEWKKAVGLGINDDDDLVFYAKSANRLAGLLVLRFNYEEALLRAMSSMKILEERDFTRNTDYVNLITFVGTCQLRLGYPDDANESYQEAYRRYLQILHDDDDIANYTSSIIGLVSITDAYIQTDHYKEAYDWTERFDYLLRGYREHGQANEDFIDKQWARLNFYRSSALEGMGRSEEAGAAYQEACKTRYSETPDGIVEGTRYLFTARRWAEAADKYEVLDEQTARYESRQSLEHLQTYLLPRYKANLEAHRDAKANLLSAEICRLLDSAIVMEEQDAARELATIYETQKKEMQLAEQKALINRQRFIWSLYILILVILSTAVFLFFRRMAERRLKAAYKKLDISNARAEEASRMKSNFIHQISHEIRTPLNIVSGFTQVITSPEIELDGQNRNQINRQICESTDRITGLVNKMLELSDVISKSELERNDSVSVERISLEAADVSGITTAKHLKFDMLFPPGEPGTLLLRTNKQAAVRALSLVLENARKFTAPAEDRQHNTPTEGHGGRAVLSVSQTDKMALFAVEDNGIGIPVEKADTIFDEFVQLNDYYDGTGIGLPVARALARRLGGDLVLDKHYTGGARFILSLPL